jgi:hypothetical protein
MLRNQLVRLTPPALPTSILRYVTVVTKDCLLYGVRRTLSASFITLWCISRLITSAVRSSKVSNERSSKRLVTSQ